VSGKHAAKPVLHLYEVEDYKGFPIYKYETMTNGYTYLIPHRPMTDDEAGIG
jgi:hypothetical protein